MMNNNLQKLAPSYIREILSAATRPDMISFAGGLPDPESFPFRYDERVIQQRSINIQSSFNIMRLKGLRG